MEAQPVEAGQRLAMILKTYQVYFRKLAFEQLPRIAERYLGELGFRIVAEALAEATIAALPGLLEAVKGVVEPPTGDPLSLLEVHYQCHTTARSIAGDQSIPVFRPRRESPDRVVLEADECPFNASGLQLAAFAGIALGVLRAAGVEAYAVANEEAKRYLPPGSYAVWSTRLGDKCIIAAERLASRGGREDR